MLYVSHQLCYNGSIKTNKVTNMKQALKTIGLLICFVAGVFLASIYQGLVAFTGQAGYIIAVLGAALAIVSGLMLIIGGVKKLSSKVVI